MYTSPYPVVFKPGALPNSTRPKHIVFANQLAKKIVRNALKEPSKKSAKVMKQFWKTIHSKQINKNNLIVVLKTNNMLNRDCERYVSNANARTFQAFVNSLRKVQN